MKKSYLYTIIIVALLIFLILIKNDTKTFETDGIKYAVSVNGEKRDKFPSKGSYTVNIECKNASASWNYQEWVAEIYNIIGKVSCDISFTGKNKTTFATYIKNLLGTNTSVLSTRDPNNSDGSTLEKIIDNGEEDYRYRGQNPNNYVMFNNELWRIIGVFDDNTHGLSNKKLVKIIRNSSIGKYIWDNTSTSSYHPSTNIFSDSDLYKLLKAYYNHLYATNEDYCYLTATTKGNCDFTGVGIQSEYQNMVESNAKWFLGGHDTYEVTAKDMYASERKGTQIVTPIALIYASDYGYAFPDEYTRNLNVFGAYANLNWLKYSNTEWTLTKRTSLEGYVFNIVHTGSLSSSACYGGAQIRPTLYLKSDVYYISGTGTQADPYIINI